MFGQHTGHGGRSGGAKRFAGPLGGGGRPFGGRGRWGDDDDGFGGGRGGGRGEGRGPGRRRMFDSGQLRLVLLRLIADEARHGYELIRAIEERTGGAYAPSPGVVYPTLTLLAETGLVTEKATEGARKLYEVTPEGEALLAEHAVEIAQILARLDATAEQRGRLDVAPVKRAMHNLRSVLMNRLEAGLDTERLHQAVALIDEAASKIERL